jgi:hypothetical protein
MKTFAIIAFLALTTSVFAQPANDDIANANTLTDVTSWASADAAYTNVSATADNFPGSGYVGVKNVWFKFQADGPAIDIRILTGGTKGTLQGIVIKLFDNSGVFIKTVATNATPVVSFPVDNLVDNDTYYFSIDQDGTTGVSGTFSLEVNNALTFDSRLGAQLLSDLTTYTSGPAAYTTVGSTPDDFNGAPWYNVNNVWFKFQATTTEIEIRINIGGSDGTLVNPQLKLYDATGALLSQHGSVTNLAFVQNSSLAVNSWYYFYVDGATPGTFTVSVNNVLDFDYRPKAFLLSDISDWQSANAAYSNVNATPDDFAGAPWYNYKSVWFKFQATTSQISIALLTGGAEGTLINPGIKLYDASGTQLGVNSNGGAVDTYLRLATLTPGDWYYFSIDVNMYGTPPGDGTFTLKIDDTLGYDYKAAALILDHLPSWCSADAFFDTTLATADESNTSSCGPAFIRNVWFKFRATSTTATIRLQSGAGKGTIGTANVFLMSESGSFVACDPDEIASTTLTKGAWYYIIVDGGNPGTFTLCLEGGAGGSLCENIYCDQDGVGINTPFVPQGYALAVKGKVIAEGVKVQFQENWPDFVFDPGYKLADLQQVKQFISINNHLPGVPSATEIKNEGVDVGDMNAKLLLKIEEMTLYMIRMEERLQKLEKENETLKSEKH